jgi:hypothetical protein
MSTKVFLPPGENLASYYYGPTHSPSRRETMSSALFAVGYLLVVAVVSYLAYLSHIPEAYIFAMDVIMLGIGVVSGIENARQKDSDF